MKSPSTATRTSVSAAALALSLAAALAACGGSAKAASSVPASAAPAASGTGTGTGTGTTFQGASGTVAAITGASMEVQNPSTGQTTVSWNASTRFTETASLTASSVTAGDCVTVIATSTGATLTARSVSVSQPSSSGTCRTGFGPGGRGLRRQGGTSARFRPPGNASRNGGAARAGGPFAGATFAAGKVVTAGPTSLVLDGTEFSGLGRGTGPRSPTASTPPTSAAPADITIGLSSSTVYNETRVTDAGALAVGDCVLATGPADSTGAVTARSVRITSTGGQSCRSGFSGLRAGGGAGNG